MANKTGIAWQVDVLASRVINWLGHAPLILQHADHEFYVKFIKSLREQTQCLCLVADLPSDKLTVLRARIAVALSSICLGGQSSAARNRHVVQAASAPGDELLRQFSADGGHISRNPDAGLAVLVDLLPLLGAYHTAQVTPPYQLQVSIDRIVPMLKFFVHRDGRIAQFNGGGRVDATMVAAVLELAGQSGQPPDNALNSGYQRLVAGDTSVIIDTGETHAKSKFDNIHAGCLSFEMSSGSNQFIVNCGTPDKSNDKYDLLARASAAHSTAILNDTSSCRFDAGDQSAKVALTTKAAGGRIRSGNGTVATGRFGDDAGEIVTASHEGYKSTFGIIHQRSIFLDRDGNAIHGIDRFDTADGQPITDGQKLDIAVRFHLHPDARPQLLADGISILITTENGDGWKFTCIDAPLTLEDSIYFADRPMPTRQIVLDTSMSASPEIRWVFERCSNADVHKSIALHDGSRDVVTRGEARPAC